MNNHDIDEFSWCDSVRTKLKDQASYEKEYGVKKRATQRKIQQIKNEGAILKRLAELDPHAGCGEENHLLNAGVIEELINYAKTLESSANCIILAINFIRKLVIKGNNNLGWNVATPSPALKLRNYNNPISSNNFPKLEGIGKELRAFDSYLLEADLVSVITKTEITSDEKSLIWGITLYALAYLSACLDKKILLSIMRGDWHIERYDFVWIDVTSTEDPSSRLCRIFPDAISMVLLQTICKKKWFTKFENTKIASNWMDKSISLLRSKLSETLDGGTSEWKSTLELWHQMYLPAQLVALAKGQQKTTAFVPHVWHRILLEKPIYQEVVAPAAKEFKVYLQDHSTPRNIQNTTSITPAETYKILKEILGPNGKSTLSTNGDKVDTKKSHKTKAILKLEEFLKKINSQQNIINAVVSWLIYKLKDADSKISISSAYQYLTTFCTYLFDYLADADLALIDDESYESIYTAIINAVSSDNSKLAKMQLIVQFHRFLMLDFKVTSINFDALPEFNGDIGAKAHFVTESEYIQAKKMIEDGSSERNTVAYFVMMLCYRCGLRIGEATHILLDDIHYPNMDMLFTDCAITLKVRPNQFHTVKTVNAERQLPLHLLLSPSELIEFKTFIADQTKVKNSVSGFLFHHLLNLNNPVDSSEVSRIIVDTLRYITLDNGITVHQLRHSFCCLLFAMVVFESRIVHIPKHWICGNHPVDKNLKDLLLRHTAQSRRPIYQIAEWMGHHSPTMSLSAYMHWGHLPIRDYLDNYLKKNTHWNARVKKVICKLVGITDGNLKTKLQKKNKNLNDTVASILNVTRLKKTQPYLKKVAFTSQTSDILLSDFSINLWINYFEVLRKLRDISKTENFLGIHPGQTSKQMETLKLISEKTIPRNGGYRLFPIPDNSKKNHTDLIEIHKSLQIILPNPPKGKELKIANHVFRYLQNEFKAKPDFIKRELTYILKNYRHYESNTKLESTEVAMSLKLFLREFTAKNSNCLFSYGLIYAITMFALQQNIIEKSLI